MVPNNTELKDCTLSLFTVPKLAKAEAPTVKFFIGAAPNEKYILLSPPSPEKTFVMVSPLAFSALEFKIV